MTGAVLIVGGGEAGLQAAVALREQNYDGRIMIVGEEPHLPYQRPPLSKGYLAGTVPVEELELRAPSFLAEREIEVLSGRRVTRAQSDDETVTITLDDDNTLDGDHLILATGATPRPLPVPGAGAADVVLLRSVHDAHMLREALAAAKDVVVVGGGFIGLEVAATARGHGKHVTVVEAEDRLLARVVAAPMSAHVLEHHGALGTDVRLGSQVTAVHRVDGRARGVELADGERIDADLVIVGIGAHPSVELAEQLGLRIERGVVTDAAGRTSHARVLAVGDCSAQPHPHRARGVFTYESVNNAQEQAKAAAAVIVGKEPAPRGVPWFWSTQGDLKLQMAGVSDGYDHHVVRGDGGDGRLTVLYYRQERLIAGDVANNPRDFNAIKRALAKGARIAPDAAQQVDVALKTLLEARD